MNWHIGQRIVAVKDHGGRDFREGDEFTVKGLRSGCCGIVIDIGIIQNEDTDTYCGICKRDLETISAGQSIYYSERSFAPIEELSDYTADELIEELTTKIPDYETVDNITYR